MMPTSRVYILFEGHGDAIVRPVMERYYEVLASTVALCESVLADVGQ